MAGAAARQYELTQRLYTIIELLSEQTGVAEPPDEAASTWTEAEVRQFFASGGKVLPLRRVGGEDGEAPEKVVTTRNAVTAAEYCEVALARGLPPRNGGSIPLSDAVIREITAQGYRFFTKHLVNGECKLAVADGWPVGEGALAHGIDLRYAFNQGSGRLAAAVRYTGDAAIGAGFWTSAHGGAIETAFDECTAEVCKISRAALATTISFACELKKAVPLNETVRVDAWVASELSGGLRLKTEATMKAADGTLLATCTATLVDMGMLSRMK